MRVLGLLLILQNKTPRGDQIFGKMKHLWGPYFVKLKGAPEPSLYVLWSIYNEL